MQLCLTAEMGLYVSVGYCTEVSICTLRTEEEGQISTKAADEGGAVTAGRVPDIIVQANVEYRTTTVTPRRTTEASTDITTITIIRVIIIIIIVDGD